MLAPFKYAVVLFLMLEQTKYCRILQVLVAPIEFSLGKSDQWQFLVVCASML